MRVDDAATSPSTDLDPRARLRQYLSALGGMLAAFESMQSAAPALARGLALFTFDDDSVLVVDSAQLQAYADIAAARVALGV